MSSQKYIFVVKYVHDWLGAQDALVMQRLYAHPAQLDESRLRSIQFRFQYSCPIDLFRSSQEGKLHCERVRRDPLSGEVWSSQRCYSHTSSRLGISWRIPHPPLEGLSPAGSRGGRPDWPWMSSSRLCTSLGKGEHQKPLSIPIQMFFTLPC